MRIHRKFLLPVLAACFLLVHSAAFAAGVTIQKCAAAENGSLLVSVAGADGSTDASAFSASTENGALEVAGMLSRREMKTTWFVVLDYGSDIHSVSIPMLTQAENRIMSGLSGLISPTDEGALVLCGGSPSVAVQDAAAFSSAMRGSFAATDSSCLPQTIEAVMEYIRGHEDELNPNVAVVIVTHGYYADAAVTNRIGEILQRNSHIGTYMICVVGSAKIYGTKADGWRDRAEKLSGLGFLTTGGSGFVTKDLSVPVADTAVQHISDLEQSKALLELKPTTAQAVGRTVSLQYGGGTLQSCLLPENTYENWAKHQSGAGAAESAPLTQEPAPEAGTEAPSTAAPYTLTAHKPSDTFTVTLRVSDNEHGAAAAEVKIVYDHNALRLEEARNIVNDRFLMLDFNGIQKDAAVSLTFTVQDDAAPGIYTVGTQVLSAVNPDEEEVSGLFFTQEAVLINW